jgi:predicted 3-demethylubiquinone-9 3-methyltransferase (glyoxalase superfamily)
VTGKALTARLRAGTEGEAAASFYAGTCKDSKPGRADRHPKARPGPAGAVMAADFGLMSQKFVAVDRGPQFTFHKAISFQIPRPDQAEEDYRRARPFRGRARSCLWLAKDTYGLSWQVIPSVLIDMISDPGPGSVKRVTPAVLAMTQPGIVTLQKA